MRRAGLLRARLSHPRRILRGAGALSAMLALLAQIVVALLPMPGMAGVAQLCVAAPAVPASPHRQKTPLHPSPDCPVCQAQQLAANLLAPPSPVLAPPRLVARSMAALVVVRAVVSGDASSYKARAPPSFV
jgi:hypothetical protein